MNEKEKNVLKQELVALEMQDLHAAAHGLKITMKMSKCAFKEDLARMTPNKWKVIEEMQLQWRFIGTIHEDLVKIAEKLACPELVPDVPELVIDDSLWDIGEDGTPDMFYEVDDKISEWQSALQQSIVKMKEMCI